MYTTTFYESHIPVLEYVDNYVDIPTFLECCKACPNYGRLWSCPPYDFDVEAYWKQFKNFKVMATKIVFEKPVIDETYSKEALETIMNTSISVEKQKLSDILMEEEKKYPGSASLCAGCCSLCQGQCNRPEGAPCRYPEQLRYSIESLGGNVGLTINKLLKLDLEWIEEGRLPNYFILVSGLLY